MKHISATLHFTELLLALIRGSTSLADALHILSRNEIEKPVRESAQALLVFMKRGRGFSESLYQIKNRMVYFSPMYITLIAASELTGAVDNVLEQIAKDLQRRKKASENAFNVMLYPVIVILIAVAGTVFLIFKGMPLFIEGGFLSGDIIDKAVSGIITAGIILLFGGGALFAAYFRIFCLDSNEFRIFYMMDFLLRNNVTMLDALTQCITCMKDSNYTVALVNIKRDITNGVAFSRAFSKLPHLSPYVNAWLSVADKQGNIGEICGNIKKYYEREDAKRREVFTRLIEPSVIILTGSYLLIIILSVIMPILTLAGGII